MQLEDRSLLTVTPTLSSGLLNIAFDAVNDAATLTVNGANIEISDGSVTNTFAIGSVSSINLAGTPAVNQRFTINSNLNLPGTFTSLAVDSLTFSSNIAFGARSTLVSHAMAITGADTISINSGATLFTRNFTGDVLTGNSTANSGGLNFDAKTITVGTGARILTHAGNGFQGGDITLTAKYKQHDLFLTPLFNEKQAIVSLTVADNAVIQGRNITLATDADSSRVSLFDLAPLALGPATLAKTTVNDGLTFTPGRDDGSAGPTITRTNGTWSGFSKEKTIQITGTTSGVNDGTYDVASISGDGKSLILVSSDALREQAVPSGTTVTIREVKTDLAPEDVQFVAVDSKGNAVGGTQKQSDISKNAQLPVNYNPVLDFLSGLPSPLQVSLTQSYAKTTIGDNVLLEGAGNITISSKAIGKSETGLPSLVFGLTWAESDVQAITKIGNAKITAGGDFSATSELENELSASVETLGGSTQNPTNGDAVEIPGPSISIAVARGNSISRAETSDSTVITAGSVTIDAAMTNKFKNESSATTSNAKSFAGSVGVAVSDHNEEAKAILRGTIVAGGDVEVKAKGENQAVETRVSASVNTEEAEPASPMFGMFNSIREFLTKAKDDKQDDKSKNEQSQEGESGTTLQIAGGVAIVFSDHTTQANIADNATVTVNGGKLIVAAEGESAPQASAVGSAEANSKLAVGAAFLYAEYDLETKAWIGKNATINVDQEIEVTAASSQVGGFPTSLGDFVGGVFGLRDTGIPWVSDGSITDFKSAVDKTADLADAVGELMDRYESISEGDYGFLLEEFSTAFVSGSAQPGEVTDKDGKAYGKSYAASGSFDFLFAKSHAFAWIDEGVKINQTTPNADAKQAVKVEATTEGKSLTFGGVTGSGNPFDYTSQGGEGAIGGVYAHHDHDMVAKAYIADGVQIKAKSDVEVNAENNLIVAAWDFAGASGKTFGVQGTFTVTPITSETYAYIENTAKIESEGNLSVTAKTDNIFVTLTGALAEAQKVAVGAGLGYLDVDSTTKAFIGNQTTSATYSTPGNITITGDTSIGAESSTLSVLVAASGAISRTPAPEPPPSPPPTDDPLDGESLANLFALPDETQPTNTKETKAEDQSTKTKGVTGFGLSASLGLNLIDNVTFAGIDSVTLTSGGNVAVDAKSEEMYIVATGAASLNLNTTADSSTAIAGAVSWNDIDRDTVAKINNATIAAANVTVNAEASNLIISVTAGAAFTSPTQKAKTSLGIAGSANINDLDTTVSATIAGTTKITASGDVDVSATHDLIQISIAGAVGVSQRVGIGAAFDFGFLATNVEARIGDGVQIAADGDVTVNAANDAFFISIGASIGVGTDKLGIAGSASWTNYTTNVTAAIGNNVTITSGGDVDVIADETLFIVGVGGAAGIGKDSGFGAGIVGVNIKRNVNATIGNNSTLSVAGSTVTGEHGVTVEAFTEDDLYLFGAGGAVAANRAAAAGSLSLLIDSTTTNASIGNLTSISQPSGKSDHTMSVYVTADHDSNILSVAGAFALGKSVGVGLGVVVQPITHTVTATIGSSANISANNDIQVQANHLIDVDNVGAAIGAALSGVGVAGAGVIQILNFSTTATVDTSANLRANGNIVVVADGVYDMLAIAGNGALGVGGSGIGVSNVTTIRNETVKAEVKDNASLTALGNKGTYAAADDSSTPKNVRGVIVTSTLSDDTILVAAGAAGGTSGAGIAGSANVTVQTTNVTARIGSSVHITQNTTDQAAANVNQETYVYAEHLADFVGAGGAGGFGSSGGIGVGVDVGVINRTTEAIIDTGAKVYSKNDVSARAVAGGDWISVAASIGGGGTAGVAGSASVQVHTINTKARIGDNAVVFSGNNVIVTARDELQMDSIAGQISAGGTAGVGGSVPVVVLTKTTDATIGANAQIDALANGNAYQAQVTAPTVAFTSPLFFSTSAVNVTSDAVNLGYDHGFQTGDQVTYWANDKVGIGGLEDNGNYYAIRVDSTTIKLATNEKNAKAGTAIDLTSTGGGSQQSIVAYGTAAPPPSSNASATSDGLTKQRTVTFNRTGVSGVVVSAVSQDDIATYGISAGGGGTVGVQIVASVSIPNITTTASIGNSAKINQNDPGANAKQSVTVAANADYDRLGIGGSLAIGGTAGVAPLVDVLVSKHTTKASIGSSASVAAENDVIVAASTTEDVRAFVVGIAGAGTAAVAGSVGVLVLKTQTQAIINSGANVFAGGNLLVSANDMTDATIVIGAAALGIGAAGVGASVNVSVIEKDTLARVADNASITALAKGNTISAYTGNGIAKTNTQGVVVQAASDEDILNVIVAGGAGLYAGVAGAVNVNVLTANTQAQLGNSVTVNGSGTADTDQSVIVAAVDQLDLDVIGGAAGLGAGGVAGSVDVGIIRSNTAALLGNNVTINAAANITVGSGSVRDIDSVVIGASGGLGALAASVAVYSLYDTVTQESKNSLNGSSGSNGASYADSSTKTGVISDGLGSYNQSSTFRGGQELAKAGNSAKSSVVTNSPSGVAAGAVSATPTPSGTSATVGSGAKFTAGGNISVLASDNVQIDGTTGTAAVGGVGIGASVTYLTVGGQSLASVGNNATITGQAVTVSSVYLGDGEAKAYGGAAGGFASIGAQVAVLRDLHNENASVGTNANINATGKFSITTSSNRNLATSNAGGSVAGAFAGGASYSQIFSSGTSNVSLGGGNITAAGVDIAANSTTTSQALAVGVAAGSVAINLTLGELSITGGATATVGTGTSINSTGDLDVRAKYTSTVTKLQAVGVSAGLGSVGAMDVKFTDSSTTTVNLNNVGKFTATGKLNVVASADNTIDLNVVGTSVGGVAGNGAGVTVTANPTVSTSVSSSGGITAGGAVTILARAGGDIDARTTGVSVGGLAVGVSIVTINWNPSATTTIGSNTAIVGANDVTVRSLINYDETGTEQTSKTIDVSVTAVAGGLAAGSAAVVAVNVKPTTLVTVNTGATVAATRNLVIGSEQRSRVNVTETGVNAGLISGGYIGGDVKIHASSKIDVPTSMATSPTRLSGGTAVIIRAGINHGGKANVTGGSGGLFGAAAGSEFTYKLSGPDTTSDTDSVPVSVNLGDNTAISSAGTVDIGTFVRIAFESDASNQTFGGIGAGINNDLTTESRVAALVSIGADSKIGTRNLRISTSQDVSSDTDTDARAYAGLGSGTDTDSSSRFYGTNNITIASGTTIVATGSATIENAAGNVYVRADSYARGVSFVASVDATSNGTRNLDNRVTIAKSTEIISPRVAVQSLRPGGRLDVSADSSNVSAVGFFISIWNAITGGSVGRTSNREENLPNKVDLNSAITLGSPRDVQLYVDANGRITKQNWPTAIVEPTRVVVDDIFPAQPERLDVRAPGGTTLGSSTVTYGQMETVTIENASPRTLVLGNIDTVSNGLNTPIYFHEAGSRTWTFTENKQIGYSADNVTINIRNTATGTTNHVLVSGRLDAPQGTVSIAANGGDVYSQGSNDYINSRAVTLNATNGSLGRAASPLYLRSPEQKTTTLPFGIQSAFGSTGGYLDVAVTSPTATTFNYRIQNVTSNTGVMKIVANEGATVTRTSTTMVQLLDGSEYFGTVLGTLLFDPTLAAQFSAANDTITLPYAHGLASGDRVIYQPTGDARIGGILPFIEREVRVVDAKTIQFNTTFNTNGVSTAKDIVTFAKSHGIQTGDAVVYDKNGGTASVGGLTNGTSYFAWAYDDNTVQLYNSATNAKDTGNKFYGNAVQHIKNPGFVALDKAAKTDTRTGLQKLEYIDVIALSANNTFTTGTKIEYWTHDANTIRQWTGTDSGVKYWTNELSYTPSLKSTNPDVNYAPGDLNDPANPNEDYTSIAADTSTNYVSLPTLSYFYAVEVPNPENKEEFKGLIALASSATDATDGVLSKLSTSAGGGSEPHYLRSTVGLIDITSTPTGETHSFRADLTAPASGTGQHIIDTLSTYVQDSKGVIIRVPRDQVKTIRDVVADVLTTPTGVTTTVELGTISSTNGDIDIQVGTASKYLTNAEIVDTISAPNGTVKINVVGGSLVNASAKTNLIAHTADLTTWNNIGSSTTPITGKVQFLTAQAGLSGTGGIWFENTGLLTLRNMKAVNDLQVVVVDRVGTGDDIVVDPTATVQSTAGTVFLKAGDKIIIPTSAKVVGFNGIQFFFNFNDVDGSGNIIDLRGFSGAKVIDVYGNIGTVDTILDVNDMNYVLTDNKLQRFVGKTLDTTFNLFNVTGDHFNITAGGKDNSLDVTGWTGTGVYDGQAGINRVIAVNDVNFNLSNTTFSRTGHGDITFVNNTVKRATLIGGGGENSFTVTNWTYQAFLDGAGGKDTLRDVNDVNYVLSDSSMARSTNGNFNLSNIEHAELTTGALDNRFEISEWTGTAKLDGGAGLNNVATVRDGDYDLSDTKLTREIQGTTAGAFELANIDKSLIIAGISDNTINVTGWTGQAFVDGTTGIDRVVTQSNSDGMLNADYIARGDGGQVQITNVETAVLLGGTNANSFLIEGWKGSVLVDGAGGGDKLMVNATTNYTLNATSIKLANGTNIDVANLTKVTLNGGDEDNSFTIEEQPDFYTVINAFGGENRVTVSATGDFSLTESTLAIGGSDRYFFGGVDRVVLVGTGGDNDFLIDGWQGGLAIHGGTGTDHVAVVADTNFSLTAGEINLGTGKSIDLFSIEGVTLRGGDSDNRFEINGWVGTAILEGGRGHDVVQALVPNNVRLTDGSLVVQNGPSVTLNDIERAVLIGQPGSDHTYTIENYTGEVSIIGTASAFDRLVVLSAGKFDLQAGHLVLGTGGTVDFSGIDFTVLQGAVDKQNFFNIGGGTGEVSLIGGNTGLDQVRVVADTDFVLDNSAVQLGDGTTIHLSNITKATLVGGNSDNKFNVSGWTGFAVIDGGAGIDTVISTNDTNFVLTADTLQRADGAYFALVGIENVQLTGGAGANQFIVEDWNGGADLDGGEGDDDYLVTLDGIGSSRINIDDTGSTGTDRLRVAIPAGNSPILTFHGVWLGDDGVEFNGIEDFDLI